MCSIQPQTRLILNLCLKKMNEKLPKNTVKWRTDYSFREENVLIMIRGAFTD